MSRGEIYRKEYNVLEKYRSLLKSDKISSDEVLTHLKDLTDKYADILTQIKFTTKFSDRLQKKLSFEKEKSDKLLLNILPEKIALDLKENGKTEPRIYKNVTVYFSDIVGFTKISSQIDTKFLIDELNEIFTSFDMIMEKNECERIKTIGDAYFAVCGVPEKNPDHAENILKSSIEIKGYMQNRNKTSKQKWEIRIGIHTGDVIGGVVGVKKYIFDVFGDTVNTAARMEHHSEPGLINVSETTYNILKNKYKFIERQPLEVKGKGLMKMYFLDK